MQRAGWAGWNWLGRAGTLEGRGTWRVKRSTNQDASAVCWLACHFSPFFPTAALSEYGVPHYRMSSGLPLEQVGHSLTFYGVL